MTACIGCATKPPDTGNLCASCARALIKDRALCPEQVLSSGAASAAAMLVDQWGRAHRLQPRTLVGRDVESCHVSVFQSSISRQHAALEQDGETGLWVIHDLGSTNGTYVNSSRVDALLPLTSPATIFVGDVGFLFVESAQAPVRPNNTNIRVTMRRSTVTPPDALPRLRVRLIEPTSGGGGIAELGGTAVQLTVTQFELFRVLVQRMAGDHEQPEEVRGFVPSSQLLADISWDTSSPEDNHVKQLVRRLRRVLAKAGFDDLIESRHRFGYRLRALPTLVS